MKLGAKTSARPAKVRKIEWTEVSYPKGQQWHGHIGSQLVAMVTNNTGAFGHKSIYSVRPSNDSGEGVTVDSAKQAAQRAFNKFVLSLIQD